MSLVVVPRREDFFPKTRRGHGSINYSKNPCVDPTCVLNMPKSGNAHTDKEANLREWCEERGLSIKSKTRPHGEFDSPLEAMHHATSYTKDHQT